MPRPHDFGFDDEAQLLRDAAVRLFNKECPHDALHRLVAADPGHARARECVWDRSLWQKMIDLGWTAVAVPTSSDGFGMNLAAIAGLVEVAARAAAPSPLVATLCATYALAACDSDPARDLLRRIVAGAAVSLAASDRSGEFWRTDVAAQGDALTGTAGFVQDAGKAAAFVVLAGDALYLVDAAASGLTLVPDPIIDLTRDQARLEFHQTPATLLTTDGLKALRAAEPAILVILAADLVGAAEWQLQTTAEYARTRVQFDRPIGFFQAVKHPLVDMMVAIDAARSLVYDAACAFNYDEPEQAEVRARMAKSAASDAATFCSGRSVQLHGGIGFTWECSVQIYFKRQMHSAALYGDGPYQRARLADLLIGPVGATTDR